MGCTSTVRHNGRGYNSTGATPLQRLARSTALVQRWAKATLDQVTRMYSLTTIIESNIIIANDHKGLLGSHDPNTVPTHHKQCINGSGGDLENHH